MSFINVDWNPGSRQLATFGAICAVASLALGVFALWRQAVVGISLTSDVATGVGYALLGLAAICATLSWRAPGALWLPYVVLTAISLPIGFVVSHVIVAVLFFLVLTPFGLLFRLFGRDPLQRRFERSSTSYWTPRPTVTDDTRYYHQF